MIKMLSFQGPSNQMTPKVQVIDLDWLPLNQVLKDDKAVQTTPIIFINAVSDKDG